MPRPSRILFAALALVAVTAGSSLAQVGADWPMPGSGLTSPIAAVTDAPSRAPQSIQRYYINLLTRLALRALARAPQR